MTFVLTLAKHAGQHPVSDRLSSLFIYYLWSSHYEMVESKCVVYCNSIYLWLSFKITKSVKSQADEKTICNTQTVSRLLTPHFLDDVPIFETFRVTWTLHWSRFMIPMMQRRREPAGTFKTMAGVSDKPRSNSKDAENTSTTNNDESRTRRRLSFSSETSVTCQETSKVLTFQSVPDTSDPNRPSVEIAEQLLPQAVNTCLKTKNITELSDLSLVGALHSKQHNVSHTEDKENTATPSTVPTAGR